MIKTSLLSVFALVIGISVSAQKIAQPSADKQKIKIEMQREIILDESGNTSAVYVPGSQIKSFPGVNEAPIGLSLYDLQSNASVQNRIYAYPDGTVGAVWTQGNIPGTANAFNDRGTGYNYFDGASWGPIPTTRISSETLKNGWPSYAPLGNGEIIISHTGASGLYLTKRPEKGTGAWTSTLIPVTAAFTWPRAITDGNSIHLLVNSGAVYQGLTNALLYYRSTNGGTSFTGPTILPGLAASDLPLNADFTGIGGDSYAWGAPRGDSLCFVVTDGFGGIWAFKSFDNGLNWSKVTVFNFPNLVVNVDYATTDDKSAIAMDKMGKVHVVSGRMRYNDDDLTNTTVGVYFYTDGLVYWNENMPALDTAQLANLDTLDAHGNLIAYMQDYNGNGEIDFPAATSPNYPFGRYAFSSLSSMPQIAIDNHDNIFVSFSQCREDLVSSGATPSAQLYRHLFLTKKMASVGEWIEPRDLTDDIEHSFDECVFASMSYSMDDKLHFIYQLDPEPGMAINGDLDPNYTDNYMNYLTFPTFVSTKPVDIAKDVMVSPNPASEYANVQVLVNAASKVSVNVFDVMGKLVMDENYGQQTAGYHTYKVNTSSLNSGIYLFTVKIGNSQTSRKVVVE
jgi:hypothetical protein